MLSWVDSMEFGRLDPQAKKAAGYRMLQQQTVSIIHTLLLAGVDPLEITDEEVDIFADIKESSPTTDRQLYLRNVAHLKKAFNMVKQKLEMR